MSDALVVAGTFVLTYGAIVGYSAYLHLRKRRAES